MTLDLSGFQSSKVSIYLSILRNLSKMWIPGPLAIASLGLKLPESGSATSRFRDTHAKSGQGLESSFWKQSPRIKTNGPPLLGIC